MSSASSEQRSPGPYVLGLDIGITSIGWALLDLSSSKEPTSIRAAGTHLFESAVEGDIAGGRDAPKAAARRGARQPRRQTFRRRQRLRRIFRTLQEAGLLPGPKLGEGGSISTILDRLDADVRQSMDAHRDHRSMQVIPYLLRATALDQPLSPHHLGRTLYHLAQRRGFESNRRTAARESSDERSTVKRDISELNEAIVNSGARTIGEYFSTLDPHEERIRMRWTGRRMYREEFEAIRGAQAPHHPSLSDAFWNALHHMFFYQRPLKSQAHLIGRCSMIPDAKRSPIAHPIAQRFRLLQKVNDLRILPPDSVERELSNDERLMLLRELELQGDQSFPAIRKLLKLPKGTKFNFEEGGEKKLIGNRTVSRIYSAFGERWCSMDSSEQDRLIDDLRSIEKPETLERRLVSQWSLRVNEARELAEDPLEEGYAAASLPAIRRLLPSMERGMPFMTARLNEFPESFASGESRDLLPPVLEAVTDLRNPAVCRTLTELRKLVNALIRRHGKPDLIRVELARDLKRPRTERERMQKRMRVRETERERAAEKILRSNVGIARPRRSDIDKILLADECGWQCPFTGRPISMEALLGPEPQFDIEHILPFSMTLDDSFANRTLCHHEENRHRKRNRTPWQAYHHNQATYDEILVRVQQFRGDLMREKLRRFMLDAKTEDISDDFSSRQLNDTRYASRVAAEYLGLLYGGVVDGERRRRVQVSTGQATAYIRNEWDLNAVLGDGGTKSRDDHRHHAVDAIAIAFIGPKLVKRLADAARDPWSHRRRQFAPLPEPWSGFGADVRRVIASVNVSRRPSRQLGGALHAETIYGRPRDGSTGIVHVRKPVHALSRNEVESIVDPAIRACVLAKIEAVGGQIKKLESDPPMLMSRDGRSTPIRRVRVRRSQATLSIGRGARERFVATAGNHHMAIVARLDEQGNEVAWEGHVVSRYEAYARYRRKEPIVQREWGPDRRFKFSLAPGDSVFIRLDERAGLFTVRLTSEKEIAFVESTDSRRKQDIRLAKSWLRKTPTTLMSCHCHRVYVSHTGEVIPVRH